MRAGGLVALGMLVRVAHADPTLDKPAFTATANELIAAAKTRPAHTTDVFILREDDDISFDDRGRTTKRWRMIFVVASQNGASNWSALTADWNPDREDKPQVRARVIDPNGTISQLDPSRITEAAATKSSKSDTRRELDIPLPRLQTGSIVEEEITTTEREPLPGGSDQSFAFGSNEPVVSSRVTISAPAKKKLHIDVRGVTLKAQRESKDGRQRVTYVTGALAPIDDAETNDPSDVIRHPYVATSVAESWAVVAHDYAAVVEAKLKEGPAPYPTGLAKTASGETVAAIITWLHRTIHDDPGGFGESSVVPATPAETVKRGWGDTLDQATLLVSLLRQAGISANLALISVGSRVDVDPTVPSLDVFTYAIVQAKVGGKDVWIDPIDNTARPGQLRSYVQGRLALVITDRTASLVSTPAASAKENVYREVRTFELPELGDSKVTEVSESAGANEPGEREWYRDTPPDEIRKNLESYTTQDYNGKLDTYSTTSVDDFDKQLVVTLNVSEATTVHGERESASITLRRIDALTHLPEELSHPEATTKVREHDYVLRNPHVAEIENRIVIPDELELPVAAADVVHDWGAIRLIEKQRLDGRTLVVTFRLEAEKARMTPAEVTRIQDGVRVLRDGQALELKLAPVALVLASKGKFRDAIAEANRMIKQHPKEALHHLQLAGIYKQAGSGEAARREARKATELEPKNADAFSVLGFMLSHDSFGTYRGFDHDRAAAIASYQKAHSLNPKHYGAAHGLAQLLERSTKGRLYDNPADTSAAVKAWRDVAALSSNSEIQFAFVRALLWTGDYAEAEKVASALPVGDMRNGLLVAAQAVGKPGVATAVRTASSLGTGSQKTRILQAGAAVLMLIRRYDEMRALYAEAGTALDPKFGPILQGLKQHAKSTGSVEDVALDAAAIAFHDDLEPLFIDKMTAEEFAKSGSMTVGSLKGADQMTTPMFDDLLRAMSKVKVDTQGSVSRVDLEFLGDHVQVYLVTENGRSKILGGTGAYAGVGRYVFTLLAKKDDKTAMQLLDWLAVDVGPASGMVRSLPSVWSATLPRSHEAMGLAAAVLVGTTDTKRAIPILKKCLPSTKDGQQVCDLLLADAYLATKAWVELGDHARAWDGRAPGAAPQIYNIMSLAQLHHLDDADKALADALAKDPDNHWLLMTKLELVAARGQIARVVVEASALAAKSDATSEILNASAWAKLVDGNDLANAMLDARRAVQLAPEGHDQLNTAGAIAAERNELVEAKQLLDRAVGTAVPEPQDWYVHGRILEQIDLPDDAIAAYRRAAKKQSNDFMETSADLAKKRLKALGATP